MTVVTMMAVTMMVMATMAVVVTAMAIMAMTVMTSRRRITARWRRMATMTAWGSNKKETTTS